MACTPGPQHYPHIVVSLLLSVEPNVYNLRTRLMALHVLKLLIPNYRVDEPTAARKVTYRIRL